MFLNSSNYIDKKIQNYFLRELILNINSQSLDYFGINISSDIQKDYEFKIYYNNKYSKALYSKEPNIPLINFLSDKNLMNFLTIVHDKNHIDCSRYDIGLRKRTNENIGILFQYLEKECPFFYKYKDEIIQLSTMKCYEKEGSDYASLYFIAIIKAGNQNILKCHWLNRVFDFDSLYFKNEYYLTFLEKTDITGFKKLLPITRSVLTNCMAHMWMQGIDYSEQSSMKHKIYIHDAHETYDGLFKSYSEYPCIQEKIMQIQEWNNSNSQFNCDGFALGQDSNNNMTINFYFRLIN